MKHKRLRLHAKALLLLLVLSLAFQCACSNTLDVSSAGDASPETPVYPLPQSTDEYAEKPMASFDISSLTISEGYVIGGFYRVAVSEYLSLRARPDTGAERIEKLRDGALVAVLGSAGEFARVETSSGAVGFALGEYLVKTDERFERVKRECGVYTVVCDNNISLRTRPDTGAERLSKLSPYTKVTVTAFSGEFARVEVNDLDGWVLTSYLCPGEYSGSNKNSDYNIEYGYAVSCEKYVSLRESPDDDAGVKKRIADGEEVGLIEYDGTYAKIRHGDDTGWVLSGCIVSDRHTAELSIVEADENYDYDKLIKDIHELAVTFEEELRVVSAGESELGRDIPVLIIGDENAKKHILVQASIHGRERMTAVLAMAQAEYMLSCGAEAFHSGTVADAMDDVCFHIIPMSNPDGVDISINSNPSWKANANGVDINRNFDAGWRSLNGARKPGSSLFKGYSPVSEKETKALCDYTQSRRFDATVSLHAYGSLIFWCYGDNEAVNTASLDLARLISIPTQYPVRTGTEQDAGGYKDWCIDALSIPSVTVEIGSRSCPLPADEFTSIWNRNKTAILYAAVWVKGWDGSQL